MVSFNVKKVVQQVTDKIYQQTGEPLQIKGDVEFTPGFSPRITATDLCFGDSCIKKMSAALEFTPLVKGEIRVKHLLLVDGKIFIQRDENGRWTPDFRKDESRDGQGEAGKKESQAGFVPKEVILENCRVLYMDRKTRTGVDIKAGQLKASTDREKTGTWVVDLSSRRMELTSFDTGTADESDPASEPISPEIPEQVSLPERLNIAVAIHITDLVLNGTGLRRLEANLAVRGGRPEGTVKFQNSRTGFRDIMNLLSEKNLQGEDLCASIRTALKEAADEPR